MEEENKNNDESLKNEKHGYGFFMVIFALFVIALVSVIILRPKEEDVKIAAEENAFQQESLHSTEGMNDDASMKADESMDEGKGESDSMESGSMSFRGEILAGTNSPLLNFNKQDYDEAVKSDKLVVLYFYANWCPVCKKEVADALVPAFNDLQSDDVIGFQVSFKDNETDSDEEVLAREFGVAYQHTKVFLKNGERISKHPDSWDKKKYLEEIQKNTK